MASVPKSKTPAEMIASAETQWLFTEEELLRSPSILDGMPPEKERENRSKGVNFILQAGILLKLPQITLATASVFLHRFYMRHSMVDLPGRAGYHYYSMAATCLFLATKVEENCRKMKELVIACVRVAQKDAHKVVDEQDREYWRWRDNILLNEDLLLEALCFDLQLEQPYRILYELLLMFSAEGNKPLRNAAWAFISDSCLTPLCLLCPSRAIAASGLYAASRHSETMLFKAADGRNWWESIGVDFEVIERACTYMVQIYQKVPVKSGRGNGMYEKLSADASNAPGHVASPREGSQLPSSPNGRNGEAMNGGAGATAEPLKGRQGSGSPPKKRRHLESSGEAENTG